MVIRPLLTRLIKPNFHFAIIPFCLHSAILAKSARNQKQRIKNLWLYARVVIKTRDNFSLGISRSFDNNCNEKVPFKIELCVTLSLLRLLHVGHVLQNRRSALSHALHEWFSCKGKDWKIYRCEHVLLSETQIWKFHVIVCQTTSKHCTKKRASRAARLFFFIQPIKSLDLWCCCWRLFTIYQKGFRNFGWNVYGKAILVFPTGKFPKFSERLER